MSGLASAGMLSIGYLTLFGKPSAQLGDDVCVGRFCTVGRVQLEDEAMVGDGVQLLSGRHRHRRYARGRNALQSSARAFVRVVVGRGAWLGSGSILMADAGERAVVGAGAVAVKAVLPRDQAIDNPARSVRRRGPGATACGKSRSCEKGGDGASAPEADDVCGEPARAGCWPGGACAGACRRCRVARFGTVDTTLVPRANSAFNTELVA